MSKIEIKKASISDLKALQIISIQTFSETFAEVNTPENIENYNKESFSEVHLTSELNNPNSQFFIAYSDSEPIGYLKINSGKAQTEAISDHALEIHRIYVSQSFHGKKVGQLLLDKVIEIAQQSAVDYIWLGVWEENHRALRFYTKNGFFKFDTHVFILGDDKQTDLLMKLEIHKKS
ncbi:ribosomal protein S18 acetylase RimI-like enzyme [Flavobacterium sp. CG_9.10]|uniref:GNAT family N-acetyltransferase n=1 Tax=Flavobacterium sp. CG_9.10 TaxID=2787729 RepID=UPI0018CA1E6B|nr:GNAT family N-acetyltransferase [Flavobacterium sp. CG_9.10]MBG6111053.1 ribosomal protein S18 acetylase RimI-like enzyme [Flavobacterium sp. CG_9.10]